MTRLAAVLALLTAACSVGATERPAEPTIVAPPPENVVWQRTLAGVDVLGLTSAADPSEVARLEGALRELHPAVIDHAALRSIVRSNDPAATAESLGPAVAFARGPDIFVLDNAFSSAGITRLELARVIAHEMAHTAQFATADAAAITGPVVDLSELDVTQEFADAVGWQGGGGAWSLTDTSGTTAYGVLSPSEDLAESLAMVALGRANLISDDRVEWIERWAGINAETLAIGKPWWPAGATAFTTPDPLFDVETVAALDADHVEPLQLELPPDAPPAPDLAAEVTATLHARGLTGGLERIPDERLERHGGLFMRADGVRFWVEIWEFRGAQGFTGQVPEGPVLTYVMAW